MCPAAWRAWVDEGARRALVLGIDVRAAAGALMVHARVGGCMHADAWEFIYID